MNDEFDYRQDEWSQDEGESSRNAEDALNVDESLERNEEDKELEKSDEDLESTIASHSLAVRDVYALSFRRFSGYWKRDRKQYVNPLESQQTSGNRRKYCLSPIIRAGHGKNFADRVKRLVEEFVQDTVVPKLLQEENDEELITLFEELWWFVGAVRGWLLSSFEDLHKTQVPEQTRMNFLQYCRHVMIMPVYSATKHRLQRACLNTIQKLRSMYPYCHKGIMVALYEGPFEKIQHFVVKCVGKDKNELKTFWSEPFKKQCFEHFPNALDLENTRLTEFDYLTFVDDIMTTEASLFDVLPQPKGSGWNNNFEKELGDRLCEDYLERKEKNSFYRTYDYLNPEDKTFSQVMFNILADLHLKSKSHGKRFLETLRTDIKKKKIEILNKKRYGIEEQSHRPLVEGFASYLRKLDGYRQVITRRLEKAIDDETANLKVVVDECGANLHADLEESANLIFKIVVESQKKFLRFLCNGTTTKDEFLKKRKNIKLFFKYLADQKDLLQRLEAFAREEIQHDKTENLRVLAAFVKLNVVRPVVSEAFSGLFQTYNVVPINESN